MLARLLPELGDRPSALLIAVKAEKQKVQA
jgi:hypothetical protein